MLSLSTVGYTHPTHPNSDKSLTLNGKTMTENLPPFWVKNHNLIHQNAPILLHSVLSVKCLSLVHKTPILLYLYWHVTVTTQFHGLVFCWPLLREMKSYPVAKDEISWLCVWVEYHSVVSLQARGKPSLILTPGQLVDSTILLVGSSRPKRGSHTLAFVVICEALVKAMVSAVVVLVKVKSGTE